MVIKDFVNIDEVLEKIRVALDGDNLDEVASILESLKRSDQAEIFSDLSPENQQDVLPLLTPENSADILEELEDEDVLDIATRMETDRLIEIVDEMEPDEAADLLGDISAEQAEEVLSHIDGSEEVRSLLVHPDETAGGVMTSLAVNIEEDMTVEIAIQNLRHLAPDSEEIYYLFVENNQKQLVGVVSLRSLVISNPDTLIKEIMDSAPLSVNVGADQEEAARIMQRYDLLALPVVDAQNKLLGMITYDDLLDVLEDEATEDIYRLGGVPREQPADVRITSAMKTRLPWLVLNLLTALISATVLSVFESTIAQVAVLAAFFPVVAGVSGSAATQTLTVTVRGLALGDIAPKEGLKALSRELLLGLVNGVSIGLIVAIITLVWKGTPLLGVVVGASTLLNMICAGIAGVLVPLLMQKLNFDPALASPILVTTTTDTLGYFFYLGLATVLITSLV
jgi:magnesium transporter